MPPPPKTQLLFANKHKFLLCHSTSAHKHALEEILADPALADAVMDTQASEQKAAIGRFFKTLSDDPDRAFYGYGHVVKVVHCYRALLVCIVSVHC